MTDNFNNTSRKATLVNEGRNPETGDRIDGIEATALRRSTGNVLVIPPVRVRPTFVDGECVSLDIVEYASIDNGRIVWPSTHELNEAVIRDLADTFRWHYPDTNDGDR
jgi:hypothetical protein